MGDGEEWERKREEYGTKRNRVRSHSMANLENPFEPTTKNRNKRVPKRFFAINVLREEHTAKNIEGRNFVT
jgi:hypothetical protein